MKRLAIITARTPYGTGETFILTEIMAIKKAGEDFLVVPRDTAAKVFHKEAEDIAKYAMCAPLLSVAICPALLRFIATQPLTFIAILNRVILKARNIKIAMKNLIVLPKSIYLSYVLEKADVSHIHCHWASTTSTMAYIISLITKIPWSFTAHRWDITENNLLSIKCRTAAFIRTISQSGRDEMLQIIKDGSLAHKVSVMHMGVFMPESHTTTRDISNVFTILCPANLVLVKGHKYLIEACRILKNRGRRIKCLIAGDGPLQDELKAYVKELDLTDMVEFAGRLAHETILSLYEQQEVHAVILPSIQTADGEKEGIPVALVEAMAYSIPVISTKTGSIPELIGDGSGIMVEEKDAMAIAFAIEKLSVTADYYAAVAKRGRNKVEKEFNVMTITRNLMETICA